MRNWLLGLRWRARHSAAFEWCERVVYCHHNARVLADMEYRFSCVLDHATGGRMSKPYYDKEMIYSVIDDYQNEQIDDAVKDALKNVCPTPLEGK